jgi:hypothetical protein
MKWYPFACDYHKSWFGLCDLVHLYTEQEGQVGRQGWKRKACGPSVLMQAKLSDSSGSRSATCI